MTHPGRYSGFQVTAMIKWRQKSKTKKIPRASNTNPPKKSLDKKSTSKNITETRPFKNVDRENAN